jgi:hypothetical protein
MAAVPRMKVVVDTSALREAVEELLRGNNMHDFEERRTAFREGFLDGAGYKICHQPDSIDYVEGHGSGRSAVEAAVALFCEKYAVGTPFGLKPLEA